MCNRRATAPFHPLRRLHRPRRAPRDASLPFHLVSSLQLAGLGAIRGRPIFRERQVISEPAIKQDDAILNTETLFGDLRDAILDRLKAMPKPWTVMGETEQRDMIIGVENATRHLITRAVTLIAANGHPTIKASLESATVKDGRDYTSRTQARDVR